MLVLDPRFSFFEDKREPHGEGDIVSHKIKSWWKYNPLLQKPTSLDPVRPWGWYWYYGPDPASGCSYGQYHDEENDFDMITAKETIVYSPATGKPMEYIGIVPEDEVKEKIATGNQFNGCKAKCFSCRAELVSDYDLSEVDEVHCVKCGKLCEISTSDDKTIEGKKTMKKVSASREQRVQSLKRRIRASILKKRKLEKETEEKVEEQKKQATAKTRVALRNQKRVRAEEEKAEDEDDDLISLDTIMEAMEEETMEEPSVEDEALLDDEECEEGEVCAEEEEEFSEEPVEEAVEEPAEEFDLSSDEGGEGDDKDDYYDLDMVLSMVNRREKQKKKLAQKKKAKAEDEGAKEEAKPVEKKEEVVEEKKEEKPEEAEAEECDLEQKDKEVETEDALLEPVEKEEDKVAAPKEELEAMKFEPLAALDVFKGVKKEDIDMTLYHEDTKNPTWNVTVAGVPAASIQLAKQSAPDEIRSVFCSEDYAKDLMIHCEKTGFIQTMNKVKADFWANHTSNKRIKERFVKEATASFEGDRKKLLATFKHDFRTCMNIVSAGMSKNFYPDMGNALKEHLFTNLRTVGLPEQTAISVVEKSFVEGAASYFDSLFEKAEEYMSLTPESRKEIAAAISNGSTIKIDSLENATPATLSERVSQASLVANTISGTPLRVSRDVVLDTNEYKAQLRSVWHK